MSGIYKGRDMKYGVYEYGYLQVHHLFWCWCRGRVAQEQHCFSHCCHYSDNFHQPWLGQQKSAKKVVKGSFYTLTFNLGFHWSSSICYSSIQKGGPCHAKKTKRTRYVHAFGQRSQTVRRRRQKLHFGHLVATVASTADTMLFAQADPSMSARRGRAYTGRVLVQQGGVFTTATVD